MTDPAIGWPPRITEVKATACPGEYVYTIRVENLPSYDGDNAPVDMLPAAVREALRDWLGVGGEG